jgi:hypothetical protein
VVGRFVVDVDVEADQAVGDEVRVVTFAAEERDQTNDTDQPSVPRADCAVHLLRGAASTICKG